MSAARAAGLVATCRALPGQPNVKSRETFYHRLPSEPRPGARWAEAPAPEARAVVQAVQAWLTSRVAGEAVAVHATDLTFYPGYRLYEVSGELPLDAAPAYVVGKPGGEFRVLDWTRKPIAELNVLVPLTLDGDSAAEYLRFYLAHVSGPAGRYRLIERAEEMPWRDAKAGAGVFPGNAAMPLRLRRHGGAGGGFDADATVLFRDSLRRAHVLVAKLGNVLVMLGDPLLTDLPVNFEPEPLAQSDSRRAEGGDFDLHSWLSADIELPDFQSLRDFAAISERAAAAGIVLDLLPLPFFTAQNVWLLRCIPRGGSDRSAGYGLWSPRGLFPLDGSSAPVHEANEREGLVLNAGNALAYTTYFCRFVYGDDGPFRVVTSPADLNVDTAAAGDPGEVRRLEEFIATPRVAPAASGTGWSLGVTVQYGAALFRAAFTLAPDGLLQMDDDQPLKADIAIDERRNARPLPWKLDGHDIAFTGSAAAAPRVVNQRSVLRSVDATLIRAQLLRALRAGAGTGLFTPSAADDAALLRDFAGFVVDSAATVIIESRADYVERVVGDLLEEQVPGPVTVKRSNYVLVPEPRVDLPDKIEGGDLVEISLHESGNVFRPRAFAFVLGYTDAPTLIGCRSANDVPEPLRQLADLVLRLEGIDEDAFREVFCTVFDCAWPDGHDLEGEAWLRYLEPADLQRSLRDRAFRESAAARGDDRPAPWSPGTALAAIRRRVEDRLQQFLPREQRRLADLVGLGEARQIVADMVADFLAALAGRVSWSEVDRGMLLTGPPGTGKTMLARVLARECGFRFVSARVADWMTGDANLGAVIAAMHQTFADARQYAPCILFIDEIDSIGSRRDFDDHNAGWDVAFLTAVLAELQGFEANEGIFVIGATNHEERVDPALRRAGRLDQVVRLNYPPVPDLAEILEQYLAPYRAAGRIAGDVDSAAIGAVMAGASGAEVEQFVRDAARRARRDSAPISQRHLVAAASGVPRRPAATAAMMPAELERTAWHEAGHAVAELTGRGRGQQLSIVSIVPRGDGTLGYVGFVPDAVTAMTAADYRDRIEVMLAGRAAEDLRYGAGAVSTGAGGASESCDLAVATRLALKMLGEAGFGRHRPLLWRRAPAGTEDVAEIEAVLEAGFAAIRTRLQRHWPLVEALVAKLLAEHQLLGPQVEQLAREHGVQR